MEGYSGAQQVTRDRMTAPTTPARLPEALRGEQYAFVDDCPWPRSRRRRRDRGSVGVGKMINEKSDLDPGAMLPGVAILTRRADALAMSLASTELASVRADRRNASFVLDVALDESFLVARLDDSQRVEAAGFEGESGVGRPPLRRGPAARRRRRRARGLLAAAGDGARSKIAGWRIHGAGKHQIAALWLVGPPRARRCRRRPPRPRRAPRLVAAEHGEGRLRQKDHKHDGRHVRRRRSPSALCA